MPLTVLVSRVVHPLLREVGTRWADGRLSIAQERLVSSLLRSRLQHMAVLAKTLRGRLEGAMDIVRVERGAPPAAAGDKPPA